MSEEMQQALREMEERLTKVIKQEVDPKERKAKEHKKVYQNTKKLLKNYSKFIEHYNIAEFTASTLVDQDLLDTLGVKLDQSDIGDVYVKSMFQTKERTAVMLQHINRVLDFYKHTGIEEHDQNKQRRYKVIRKMYVERMTTENIAKELNIDESTVFRDIGKAIDEISPLLFGIDALKLE